MVEETSLRVHEIRCVEGQAAEEAVSLRKEKERRYATQGSEGCTAKPLRKGLQGEQGLEPDDCQEGGQGQGASCRHQDGRRVNLNKAKESCSGDRCDQNIGIPWRTS